MSVPRFILSTVTLPWPPDQGSKRFTLELARSLRAVGEVTWISRATQGHEAAREALEKEGFRILLDESWASQDLLSRLLRRVRGEWEALRRNIPRRLTYACTPAMRELVSQEIHRHPESVMVGAYWFQAPAVRLGPEGRRVLVLADLEYYSLSEKLGRDPEGPLPSSAERVRRAEKEALMSCDALLCITEVDRGLAQRALHDIPYALHPRLGLWPAVIPVPEQVPPLRVRPKDEAQRWLVYGHWSAEFNRDGLLHFMSQVWPALQRGLSPAPRLRIAGGGLDANLRKVLEGPGVELVGWLEDLEPELAACDAVVVPLEYAGGLRYRMLEAMAAGRPVICTPVAARGSEALPEKHYLEAETAADWRRAWRVLQDPPRARTLAEAGHRFVQGRYGDESRGERVRQVLSETLGAEFPPGHLDGEPDA